MKNISIVLFILIFSSCESNLENPDNKKLVSTDSYEFSYNSKNRISQFSWQTSVPVGHGGDWSTTEYFVDYKYSLNKVSEAHFHNSSDDDEFFIEFTYQNQQCEITKHDYDGNLKSTIIVDYFENRIIQTTLTNIDETETYLYKYEGDNVTELKFYSSKRPDTLLLAFEYDNMINPYAKLDLIDLDIYWSGPYKPELISENNILRKISYVNNYDSILIERTYSYEYDELGYPIKKIYKTGLSDSLYYE